MSVTVSADLCNRCSQPSDDLVDRAHGERICGRCRSLEQERYDAATAAYRDAGFDGLDPPEQSRRDGDR